MGEIVRGTQIYNLFGQIRPPNATEIKINRATVRRKNPEKLQILKPQYLDLLDFVSDDFFFYLGVFLRETQIYNYFLQILHRNILKMSGMSRPSFFFSEKKNLQK